MSDFFKLLNLHELKVGNVYTFKTNKINSEKEHRFIVCCLGQLYLFSTVITSSKKYVDALISQEDFEASTLVVMDKEDNHQIDLHKSRSYVNCNSVLKFEKDFIPKLLKSGSATFVGELGEDFLIQILNGICNSDVVDDEEVKLLAQKELRKRT